MLGWGSDKCARGARRVVVCNNRRDLWIALWSQQQHANIAAGQHLLPALGQIGVDLNTDNGIDNTLLPRDRDPRGNKGEQQGSSP